MKMKMIVAVMVMSLVSLIQAQETAKVFNKLQTQSVSATQQEAVGTTVSPPQSAAADPVPSVVDAAPVPTGSASKAPVSAGTTETVTIAAKPSSGGSVKGGLISLNLKDAELSSVIRLFATLSDVNIIVPELEAGVGATKVDVNLKNVEWKPALQAILDAQNLELYEKIPNSNVYGVRKKLPPAEAVKSTRTFVFKNADITQAAALIKGIVGDRGEVFAYPQGNAIVVKTTQEIMDDVAQVSKRIDTPRQQVLIQARILELTDSKNHDLGVDWSKSGGLLKRALTISPDLQYKLGNIGQIAAAAPATSTTELTLNAGQLNLVLSALDQVYGVKMVSSPQVIVANGETAKINILTKIPRLQRTLSQSQANGGGTLTTVEVKQDDDGTDENTLRKRYAEYEFGIRLAVTPTVYSDNNIAVHVVPIISRENTANTQKTLVGDVDSEPVYDTYYAIDEKRVETTFMLADTRTAVIGGLTESSKENTKKKVPFLGSIPLLRHLFTYTYTANVQKENVIFLTVTLQDGQNFDVEKAVKTSPLIRKQIILDQNNQIIDDRTIEAFKDLDQKRITDELKKIEKTK